MNIFASDSSGPYFRYIMFVTSWIWLLFTFWFFAIPSIIFLVLFNVPGDLAPKSEGVFGLPIPGKLRVILEVSTATLGLLASLFFGFLIPILQLFITIAYLRYDGPRLSWLWGWATFPPLYVTQMYKKEG